MTLEFVQWSYRAQWPAFGRLGVGVEAADIVEELPGLVLAFGHDAAEPAPRASIIAALDVRRAPENPPGPRFASIRV